MRTSSHFSLIYNYTTMEKIILLQYLNWQFIDSPKTILKGWKNFLLFNLDYFSVPVLLRTFFSHWHKYYLPYGKSLDPWRYFEAFVFNVLMSRLIGAILRTFFIIIGVLTEILIFLIGLIVFLGWLILPFVLIFGFIYGLRLILI